MLCSTTDSPVAYGGWSAPAQRLTPIPLPRGTVIGKSNGRVEVGVTCVGGMEGSERVSKKPNAGRGQVGKSAMAGIGDCETNRIAVKHVEDRDATILPGLVHERTKPDTLASSDDARADDGSHRPLEHAKRFVGGVIVPSQRSRLTDPQGDLRPKQGVQPGGVG